MEKAKDLLLARLRVGKREAVTEFIYKYYAQIYLFMRRLGYSRHASEDLTQECFLQAWYHIGQLRQDSALNAWLYRIATNVAKMHWRRQKGEQSHGIDEVDMESAEENGFEKVAADEELERLKKAVKRLPVKLRQVVVLHYLQRLPISEAAEAAGVGQSAFKYRLGKGLKILKKLVAAKDEESL